jgi:hypothetical protein
MDAQTVFLGVIAFSTLVMAVGAAVAAIMAARAVERLERALEQLQNEVRPLIGKVTIVTEDTARITALVAAQVERADEMLAGFTRRVDDVIALVENAVVAPAREGVAVIAALRAVFQTLRGFRDPGAARARADEEDALFIG